MSLDIPEADSVFEFNNMPIGKAQQIWLNAWTNKIKMDFEVKINRFMRTDETVQSLANLFIEANEVRDT